MKDYKSTVQQTLLIYKSALCFAFCMFFASCIVFALDAEGAEVISQSTNVPVSVRIKDIARISCIYDVQLHGYGLVMGLNGTGDSAGTRFTTQSVINMMQQFGIDIPGGKINVKNVAAVMVTAELSFFAKTGARVDVLVSSIGDATSISGGTLFATPLSGLDGQLYVLAQGPVLVGGYSTSTGGGDSVQKNHPTVGRVPGGGMIQRVPPRPEKISDYREGFTLYLSEPDFTTATRMASAINDEFPGVAESVDSSAVKITVPGSEQDLVAFISRMENLMVAPDHTAEVIIDERTGTIVIGSNVRIAPVAISHGSLNIQIKAVEEAVQPPPMSTGETVVITNEDLTVQEEKYEMQVIRGGTSIDELVMALNLIGVSPRDLIVILQTMKKAGALHARLVIM